MQGLDRPPVAAVVQQHAEDCAHLRHVRSVLVRAPHVRLRHLRRLDDRIAAHLDGLVVAGAYGRRLCTEALASPGAGAVFAAAVLALGERDQPALERLLAVAAEVPDARRGLLSALGWLSAGSLQGTVQALLLAPDASRRALGLAACRLHGVDPGAPLLAALRGEAPVLRAEALRTAAVLGRADLLEHALAALDDAEVGPQAAWAACLLGDRGPALRRLAALAQGEEPAAEAALGLLLQASAFAAAQELVAALSQRARQAPALRRRLVRAVGVLGDVRHLPWLIGLMDDPALARLAGEAFSLVTGADLADLDLERRPPVPAGGPSGDPRDDDVALDEDESLPWPDRERVQRWWEARASSLAPGRRVFMGEPPSAQQAARVLREGTQRQRLLAARALVLLEPGRALFNVRMPAWRQQRRLAA
ncbi:TIGR02270 family protein [Azohydromonas sp. G-1-1-14]|uniref:TIGR02270 family protein n=2 Tax=Azohydromonas caseinilytica TaxID=2728836 RepID=A0A848FFR6_9BURK|nr:TIGR02270 family protein [Azohydromonas caseinilytica]